VEAIFARLTPAKRVKQGLGLDDWIPSPMSLGDAVPLSYAEVVMLYQTNTRVSPSDERELNAYRPDVATLPSPKQVSDLVEEMDALSAQDLGYREDLWNDSSGLRDLAEFDRMLTHATKVIEFLRDASPWKLEAVLAGRNGDKAKQVLEFVDRID